ncbi:MAG: M28 family peptidase [Bacteroidales bacterium]|nr:M28 family peptidase [Bacteroidales bacterium]
MNKLGTLSLFIFSFIFFASGLFAQSRGLRTINEQELRYHLDFLGAKEFRGRETPSTELDIVSLYLANWAKHNGLKPIMENGSYYQDVPLNVTAVFRPGTKLTIKRDGVETVWYFGKSFGANFTANGSYAGNVLFAGSDINALHEMDLRGRIIVIIDDDEFPTAGVKPNPWLNTRLASRLSFFREKGASAVLAVVSPEKQERISTPSDFFDYVPTGRLSTYYESQRTSSPATTPVQIPSQRPSLPFTVAEVNHALAAALMGISQEEVKALFADQRRGVILPPVNHQNVFAKLDVVIDTYKATARNVLAVIEGSDPVLKNEYVVVSSHHDGRGIDDGEVIPGADDNLTGVVAMLEIARALLVEKPKRSVIFAWMCGEEQLMHGSNYFVNNCPVPIEKISACINLDMLGRNHRDSLYLIGSDILSSELDQAIIKANNTTGIKFGFDYRYSNTQHPLRIYFRSDHYPFLRFGIPSVWFFCGLTDDYHTYRDVVEYVDFNKFFRATKLGYLTVMEVANKREMLRLDINPAVLSRGAHNLNEPSLYQR